MKVFYLWVDWIRKVVSFEKAEVFEELRYATHDEIFWVAIEREMKDLESSKEETYETLHKRKSLLLG